MRVNYGGEGNNAFNNLIIGGDSGFSALLGGFLNFDGIFYGLGAVGMFWSSSPDNKTGIWVLTIFVDNENEAYMGSAFDIMKFSVRCIYDN